MLFRTTTLTLPAGCVMSNTMPAGYRRKAAVAIALLALAPFSGCDSRVETPAGGQGVSPAQQTNSHLRVRAPAVAGLFYPASAPVLAKTIDGLLESAPSHPIARLKGLICPHAGYQYSGPTAAIAYKTLAGRDVQTVFILGPSHYALFQGASVPNADAYQTPLGNVLLSAQAAQLAKTSPFVLEPRCLVQRPDWSAQSSKPAPPAGEDTPDTWEHSVEVEIPFLQKTLKNFTILPVVYGNVDPEQAARVLSGMIDGKTIVVASSDLSHYYPYDQAKVLDSRCVKAICDLNIEQMKSQEACGKAPILTLMYLAREKGWKAQLLDARNSGDTSGDKSRVVGYAAIAFYEPAPQNVEAKDRKFLLDLARQTLTSVAADHNAPGPGVNTRELSPKLSETKGVLRHADGKWRAARLHRAYRAAGSALPGGGGQRPQRRPARPAFSAGAARRGKEDQNRNQRADGTAAADLQFAGGPPEQIGAWRGWRGAPHRLQRGATYLPQVWEQLPDKVQFLNHLAEKAGCAPGDWRGKNVSVSIYHVEAFAEPQ